MLTTKENVKGLLGISVTTHDTLITQLIASISGFVEKVCNRKFGADDFEEYFDGGGKDLMVKNYPINTLTSVKYNSGTPNTPIWTDVEASYYVGFLKEGIVHCLLNFPRGYRNIQVKYNGGFDEIPAELDGLASELVAEKFTKRKAIGKNKESMGGASIEWRVGMSDEQKAIIDSYKKIVV
jgi:hypothetical protein